MVVMSNFFDLLTIDLNLIEKDLKSKGLVVSAEHFNYKTHLEITWE